MGNYLGTHALYDLGFPIDSKILTNKKLMIGFMKQACRDAGATILHTHIHKFTEAGFSFTLILAESHATAHTWPEHGVATVDIYMCGQCNAHAAMDTFVKLLKCNGYPTTKYHQSKVFRGWVNTNESGTDTDDNETVSTC